MKGERKQKFKLKMGYRDIAKSAGVYKEYKICDGCDKKYIVTHNLQRYCPTCRKNK